MARPKLPIAQSKGLTITVRMRLDLDEGLAAVALPRRTTKRGPTFIRGRLTASECSS